HPSAAEMPTRRTLGVAGRSAVRCTLRAIWNTAARKLFQRFESRENPGTGQTITLRGPVFMTAQKPPMSRIINQLKQWIRIGLAVPGNIAFWLSGFCSRKPDRWLFGSYANAFNDNAKALYIHVTEHTPHIEAIWISGNRRVVHQIRAAGGKAFLRWSPAGIRAALTSGYWFYNAYVNDINYSLSRGAKLLNL